MTLMQYEPRYAEAIAARRAARLARAKRRQPYRLKPDLPGMQKRMRRYPLPYEGRRLRSQHDLLRAGVLIRCRPRKTPRSKRKRELLPRPKRERSNKRLYRRAKEHARGTLGREGINLLAEFLPCLSQTYTNSG